MARARTVLGLIGGAILVLSSAAHSLLGWKQLRSELASVQAPPDLVLGLAIGWQFGGVAMLALGCIVISLLLKRLKGENVSSFPALVVASAYLGFGTWAIIVSHMNPFFLVFVVPGCLLAVAALPVSQRGARQ
jgi:uncharacterized membrane protein YhaH (DUF805 family)